MSKDFYEILGIPKSATEDEIKRAYRKLAQKHHPDRTKGDKASEAKFKEINSAYEVLGDKKKRQTYDQFGQSAFQGGAGGGGFGGQPGGFDFSGFQDLGGGGFADIFETFFGGGRGGARSTTQAQEGEDLEVAITISFEEAAFGTEKELRLNRIGECTTCAGKGMVPGSKMVTCKACSGTGELRVVRNTMLGQVSTRRVCDDCSGVGKIPEKKCTVCHGVGRTRVAEEIKVKIPAGISDESAIRLNGKGNAGLRGGQSGDLYVHIRILLSKKYARKGADVYSEQEVNLLLAILGGTIQVETLGGPISMKIQPGTEPGRVFKLSGHGIKKMRDQTKGDHFVTIKIHIPKKLSKRERELYEALAKEQGIELSKEKSFFEKMIGEE